MPIETLNLGQQHSNKTLHFGNSNDFSKIYAVYLSQENPNHISILFSSYQIPVVSIKCTTNTTADINC